MGYPGLTPAQPIQLEKWGTLNTRVPRVSIGPTDFAWIENWMPVADGNLRTLYDKGTALYTAGGGKTIAFHYEYNLGATNYAAVFLSDGSAVQVNTTSGATTTIGSGPFWQNGDANLPACAQWQSKYLLVLSPRGYWIWDGTALYTAGTLSPEITVTNGGTGYTTAPTVTAFGGTGSGATFTATVANGSVTTIQCTNPGTGYLITDHVQLAFTGGGSDTTCQATATITTSSGGVSGVTMVTGGSGYPTTTTVTFSGGGGSVQAQGTVVGVNGVVTGVQITNPGQGYTSAPTVTFTGSGGSGATATAQVTNGQVTAATVLNSGSGFTGNPVVTVSGDGTGAAAVASTSGVASVTVTSGSSYAAGVTPTVTFTGGGGSGATAVANMVPLGGPFAVGSVTVTNSGTGYTSPPTVVFTPSGATATAAIGPGSGAVGIAITNPGTGYSWATFTVTGNRAAQATTSLMPFGLKGSTIETYQNRVWMADGTTVSFTAPSSTTNLATSSGGGTYPATDSFLRAMVVSLKQANGFLYQLADSSINVVSNVQTAGNPPTTTFNNANVDPQIGVGWRDTVQAFGRALVFANTTGVYALYGGSAEKVSADLDGLFEKASFNTGLSGVTPTACVATIFNIRVYCLLFTTTDPYSGTLRDILALWNGQKWFVATQSTMPKLVGTQEVSSFLTGLGASTTTLYKLFQTASTGLTKVCQTKMFGAESLDSTGQINQLYCIAVTNDNSSRTLNLTFDTDQGVGTNAVPFTITGTAPGTIGQSGVAPGLPVFGTLYGLTIVTTAPDLSLMSVVFPVSPYAQTP